MYDSLKELLPATRKWVGQWSERRGGDSIMLSTSLSSPLQLAAVQGLVRATLIAGSEVRSTNLKHYD